MVLSYRILRISAYLGLYVVVLLYVFSPVLNLKSDRILFGYDLRDYYYYTRQFLRDSLQSGHIPWWNPYTFSGMPFTEHPQNASLLYLPLWLFILLPPNQSFSWYILLHLFIAMSGMFFLTRTFLKKSAVTNALLPAWISGLVFGLSGFFTLNIYGGTIDIIASTCWYPYTYLAYYRLFSARSNNKILKGLGLTAVILAIQILSGYPANTLILFLMVGITVIIFCLSGKSLKPLLLFLLASCLGLTAAAVDLVPKYVYISHSMRSVSLIYDMSYPGYYSLANLIEFIKPPEFISNQYQFFGTIIRNGYIGIAAIILAFLGLLEGIFRKRFRFSVIIISCLALVGLWITLGSNAPVDLYYLIWKYIPAYHNFRYACKHIILIVFSMALLSGFGIAIFKKRIIQWLAVLIIMAELLPVAGRLITADNIPRYTFNTNLINFIESDKEIFRVYPPVSLGTVPYTAYDYNAPLVYRTYSPTGYDSTILRNYYEFMYVAGGWGELGKYGPLEIAPVIPDMTLPMVNLLNIKYVLVPYWYDNLAQINNSQFKLVQSEPDVYWLFENKNVLPRFYLVNNVVLADSVQQTAGIISDRNFNFAEKVVLPDQPQIHEQIRNLDCQTGKKAGNVKIESYTPEEITLISNSLCNTFLTSSEVMYPGWTAKIDGKSVPIYEGNLAFRSVYLPEGIHRIEFLYFPKYILYGLIISGISYSVCISLISKRIRIILLNLSGNLFHSHRQNRHPPSGAE